MTLSLHYKRSIFAILEVFLSKSFTVFFTEISVFLTVTVKKNKKGPVNLLSEYGNEKANQCLGYT